MGRSKIIIFICFFVIITTLKSQGLYTNYDNKIYDFLEKCYANKLIDKYDQNQKPLTRKQISCYLNGLINKKNDLNNTDKKLLEYFQNEYSVELTENFESIEKIFPGNNFNINSNRQKYLFFFNENENYISIKSYLNIRYNFLKNSNQNSKAFLPEIGGNVSGSFYKNFGFEFFGSNGTYFGDKSASVFEKELEYNFKINELKEPKFFDRYYGYFSYENSNVQLKIGSDRITIGYGENKLILGDNSPAFNYLSLNLNFSFINFSYFHGWILGDRMNTSDSIRGYSQNISAKYVVNHRLSFEPFKFFRFGIGEMVIYGNRGVELAYLIPINFFKSAEHSLQDRDNTFLYFDFYAIPFKSFEIYGTILFDDIDFSNFGNLYFTKYGYSFGISNYGLLNDLPVKIGVEYTRLNPYLYTHRLPNNNYSNDTYPLASELQPNSDELLFKLKLFPSPKYNLKLTIGLRQHGENYFENNQLINVGGDLNFGYRSSDSDNPKFLDGNIVRSLTIKINNEYEFLKNLKMFLYLEYSKNNLTKNSNEVLFISFGLISFI